jgi:pilus assembly protein CpaB
MNRRLFTILSMAFVIAGACAFLVYRMVGKRIVTTPSTSGTQVVTAAADIPLGTVLTASNLSTTKINGAVPQGAILNPQQAIGRGTLTEIYRGEPIIESRLAGPGLGGGLAPTIPKGMRAAAVKVDQVVGVAGFVTPGLRVDVLGTGDPPGASTQDPETTTLLQNIKVLSAGTDIQRDAQGKPHQVQVVNLLVTPDQAQKLSLASNQLKIQLVLRNPLDTQVDATLHNTALDNLFGRVAPRGREVARARKPAKPAPQFYSVQVINGSSTSEAKFPTSGGEK